MYEQDFGERPAYRFLACEFRGGVLAAYAYHGSDEAEFDEGRRLQLVEGQSTRQTVESRLGAPAGKAGLPTAITLPAPGLRKTSQKTLSVFFDAGGLYVGSSLLREQAGKF